jgi:hypothetical protein
MAFSQLLFSAVRPPDAQAFSNEMSKKGRTQSISSITTMDQAFGQFGFESGDTVSRRDQIVMYHTLMGTLKQSLAELIAKNMYDDASELRDRIPVLRESFMQMQRDQEQQRQTHERISLQKAQAITKNSRTQFWGAQKDKMGRGQKEKAADLNEKHLVQKGQLAEDIACTPERTIKFSKPLIAMRLEEKSLCVGGRFIEAKLVRKKADHLEGRERRAFRQKRLIEHKKQRADLAKLQEKETTKIVQLAKKGDWAFKRAEELDKRLTARRLRHAGRDMKHTHVMDGQRKPDFTFKPVAPQRKGAASTASTYKGSLMLNRLSRGRRVAAGHSAGLSAGLSALHSFDEDSGGLSGTTTFTTNTTSTPFEAAPSPAASPAPSPAAATATAMAMRNKTLPAATSTMATAMARTMMASNTMTDDHPSAASLASWGHPCTRDIAVSHASIQIDPTALLPLLPGSPRY